MSNRDTKEVQKQEVNVIFDLLQAAYRYAGGRLPEKGTASEEQEQKKTLQG